MTDNERMEILLRLSASLREPSVAIPPLPFGAGWLASPLLRLFPASNHPMKTPFRYLFLMLLASFAASGAASAAEASPVYELRVYYTHPGKLPDLLKRFREHTCALFEKHGMVNVGYWLPVEEKDQDKLYYVLKHASRDAAKTSWTAFGSDPEWKAVAAASEANGKIVAKVDSTFLAATTTSPRAIAARCVWSLRTA